MDVKKMLQGRADSAYCAYIRLLRQQECLGHEHKLANGKFGEVELKAHCKAAEHLGAHRALAAAAKEVPDPIAAAPDLLAALKDALNCFLLDHADDHPTANNWRAAIAKATGSAQ